MGVRVNVMREDVKREDVKREELRQFHRRMNRIGAAWMVGVEMMPAIAALWRYFRGQAGLPVTRIVTRGGEADEG